MSQLFPVDRYGTSRELGTWMGVVPTLWLAAAGQGLAALWVVTSPLLRMDRLPDTGHDGGRPGPSGESAALPEEASRLSPSPAKPRRPPWVLPRPPGRGPAGQATARRTT